MPGDQTFFRTPFSVSYWRKATAELKNLRVLLIAAIFISLRIALKTVYIPVAPTVDVYIGFLVNALSGAICGPVISLMSGAISDVIGYLIKPSGPFNIVFTFIEMAGSLIYSLWLYRSKITLTRLFCAKLSVNVIVNIFLTSMGMSLLYGKAAIAYVIPRVVKNIILLPAETLALALFFGAMFVPIFKLRLMSKEANKLSISVWKIVVLSVFAVIAVVVTVLYYKNVNDFVKTFLKSVFGIS